MLCILIKILSHAGVKKKKAQGFQISHFYGLFSNMAVKHASQPACFTTSIASLTKASVRFVYWDICFANGPVMSFLLVQKFMQMVLSAACCLLLHHLLLPSWVTSCSYCFHLTVEPLYNKAVGTITLFLKELAVSCLNQK